jgi:Asp-tRNA(Asn)/Glu-tRNA(Gln) amidotransferase A subunit family amidase
MLTSLIFLLLNCTNQVRTVIQQDFKSALQEVDLLISPVAPTAAYQIGISWLCLLHLSHMDKLQYVHFIEDFRQALHTEFTFVVTA